MYCKVHNNTNVLDKYEGDGYYSLELNSAGTYIHVFGLANLPTETQVFGLSLCRFYFCKGHWVPRRLQRAISNVEIKFVVSWGSRVEFGTEGRVQKPLDCGTSGR